MQSSSFSKLYWARNVKTDKNKRTASRDPSEPVTLPPELLLATMKFLASNETDRITLARFMRASKECYQLGVPVLYRFISISDDDCHSLADSFGSFEKFIADASKTKHIRHLELFCWHEDHLEASIALLWATLPNLERLEFVDHVKAEPSRHLAFLTELSRSVALGRVPSLSFLSFGMVSDGTRFPLESRHGLNFDIPADNGIRLPTSLKTINFNCGQPKLVEYALPVFDALPNLKDLLIQVLGPGDPSRLQSILAYPRLLPKIFESDLVVSPSRLNHVSALGPHVRSMCLRPYGDKAWGQDVPINFPGDLSDFSNLEEIRLEQASIDDIDDILYFLPKSVRIVELTGLVGSWSLGDSIYSVTRFLLRPNKPSILVSRQEMESAASYDSNVWNCLKGVQFV